MYEQLVRELRKKIPEFKGIDVYFNEEEALEKGPFARPISTLRLANMGYHIIGEIDDGREGIFLPDRPIAISILLGNSASLEVIESLIEQAIGFNNTMTLEIFVILHELGHMIDCRNSPKDLDWLAASCNDVDEFVKHCRENRYSVQLQATYYREVPREKRADDFAIAKLKELLNR